MDIINYDNFYKLKLADFISNKEDIQELDNWGFMNAIWKGESIGFTEWLQLSVGRKEKSISLDLNELSYTSIDKIFSTLKLNLTKGMTKENVLAKFGEPKKIESLIEDRVTFEYVIGSKEKYYLSLTITGDKGLSYVVLMNHKDTIKNIKNTITKNDITNNNNIKELIKKRKKEAGLISYGDFEKLKHEDFFEESEIENNFSYMRKRWFAKRYDRSDFYYDKKNSTSLKIISVTLENLNKIKLKAFNKIIGLSLSEGMNKNQIETIISQSPVFSQKYGPSMIYDYIIMTKNSESYLLQVMINVDHDLGLYNVMLTPNIKLVGYKWSPYK